MQNVGRKPVGETAGPGPVHFGKGEHAIMLLTQGGPAVVPALELRLRRCDRKRPGEWVRKIMHVHRAVRGEIVMRERRGVAQHGARAVIAAFEVEISDCDADHRLRSRFPMIQEERSIDHIVIFWREMDSW